MNGSKSDEQLAIQSIINKSSNQSILNCKEKNQRNDTKTKEMKRNKPKRAAAAAANDSIPIDEQIFFLTFAIQ